MIDSDSDEEPSKTQSQARTAKNDSKAGSAKSSRIKKLLDSDSEEETEKVSQNPDESSRKFVPRNYSRSLGQVLQ